MPESSSQDTARNDSGEIATSTLAEIYAQQGLLGRALSIYRRMLARAPEDAGIADRIRSLEVRMTETPEPQPEPAIGPPVERERLPWDPPETAPDGQGKVGHEAGKVAPAAEPEPVDLPRRVGPLDAEAFRSWLDGR